MPQEMTDAEILDEIEAMLETDIMCDWDHNDAGAEFLKLANYIARLRKGESCDDPV